MAHPGATPWRQPDIADYAFLSDSRSAALVSRAGSVDWWCPPRFDAPSVLGRLLDAEAGHWSLAPAAQSRTQRSYVGDSLVLRTVFSTASGQVTLTDALGLEHG
ncbi:MAG: glycoside hydrolase family 15 protein, partial [Pseudonocardiales bacterium]|nr:glycoside hydrolase family 15 protein [Pseudonocardiales bacterium]